MSSFWYDTVGLRYQQFSQITTSCISHKKREIPAPDDTLTQREKRRVKTGVSVCVCVCVCDPPDYHDSLECTINHSSRNIVFALGQTTQKHLLMLHRRGGYSVEVLKSMVFFYCLNFLNVRLLQILLKVFVNSRGGQAK